MSIFLLVVFSIYSGMHIYLYWKIHQAFGGLGWWSGGAVLAFSVAMIFGLAGVRMLEHGGYPGIARISAAVAYPWMAVLFWLVCMFLLADAWNVGAYLVGFGWPAVRAAILPARISLPIFCLASAVLLVWGIVEARLIRPVEVEIACPVLPAGSKPVIIAQMTDLHLGINGNSRRLVCAAEIVRKVQPDLIVFTGDLVDAPAKRLTHQAEILNELHPPLGKYAVLGNHEFYSGLDNSIEFHRSAGLELLRQRAVEVGEHLLVVGVDDSVGRRFSRRTQDDELSALPDRRDGRFVILLKHKPDLTVESAGRFDLQLSGHTHGWQIFPFGLLCRFAFPNTPGLHRLDGGGWLYHSRGMGTWGPPLRLMSPPEVTVIRLVPPKSVTD